MIQSDRSRCREWNRWYLVRSIHTLGVLGIFTSNELFSAHIYWIQYMERIKLSMPCVSLESEEIQFSLSQDCSLIRNETQQAEIDAYVFHFNFPDPHQDISTDVPISSWRWFTVSALLDQNLFHCTVRRIWGRLHFTCYLHDKAESPAEKSTKQCLLICYARNITERSWLGRSNECLLSSVRVTSSGMRHSTKFILSRVTLQGIWIETWDFVWTMSILFIQLYNFKLVA